MDYKSFIQEDDQGFLRSRLIKCMKLQPNTFLGFCKDIDISYPTLNRFLHDKNVLFGIRCKIEAWCDKVEKIEY